MEPLVSVLLTDGQRTAWWWAIALGFVVVLAVAALLTILVLEVRVIGRNVTRVKASDPFLVDMNAPSAAAMRAAMKEAYDGKEPSTIGSGGSIPLLETLAHASPGAEFLLTGAEDAIANIHGANESVDPTEIEKMAVASALFIQSLANR